MTTRRSRPPRRMVPPGVASRSDRTDLSGEGRVAGKGLAEDEGVDVVRPLVSVDRFDIAQVPAGLILVGDAAGSEDLPRQAGALAGHPDVVPLPEGDLGRRHPALVLQ